MLKRDKIEQIFESWEAGRNVLLYGPPATGKTRLISELFQTLNTPAESSQGILLDLNNTASPFSRPFRESSIPEPSKVVWTTFHQSYGYEDFVLGLRPEMKNGATTLEPWAGVFLDAALELNDPHSAFKSVVIFIDEINRGNAARIFGEFMTFLDFDYREGGTVPLPLPLRQLTYLNGESESINRVSGQAVQIPEGFLFPKDIYIVATMNSVDRAAVPIDSALARRFDRIEMRPDLEVLEEEWNIDKSKLQQLALDELSPLETAYLMLDRINMIIASELGPEFELGHGLFSSIKLPEKIEHENLEKRKHLGDWSSLAKVWDEIIYPQLEDRYSGRPEQLMDLLRVDDSPEEGEYAWTHRVSSTGRLTVPTLAPVRVSDLDEAIIRRSFTWLVR